MSYEFADEYAHDRDESVIVPHILHFLWISKPLKEKHIPAMLNFEKNNPNFEVCAWKLTFV